MTAVSLIVPPAAAPISLDEAKLFARVENDAEDELIETLIDAATEHVEKCTGRQLVVATYELYRDTFPDGCCSGHPQGCAAIQLPISPLVDVVGVFYISPDTGLEIEVAADQYRVDMISQPGWIAPGVNGWPAPMQTINAVRVRFRAGYTTVPARAKVAVKALVAHWYENRPAADVSQVYETPFHVSRLITGFRVWGA